ncbi:MAG TPA: putative glycoside hydrolase, partial [Longimicrobiales bacterium]|nr:putative glycoside hydrolase [Longimicrobiales bacterium]
IKDASGYVSYATGVPLAREVGATGQLRIHDLPGLLRRLSEEGIYPIARIVVIKDPILVAARPDLAVQDTAGGVWIDGKDIRWLNAYNREVWDYQVDLAREVARLGFPEIQWDYVRFPDAPRRELDRAAFPGSDGMSKPEAIRAFLGYSRERLSDLGVVVTADVFGVTTSARDVGIGQIWERMIDAVDVALPMVYPSHYWKGSFGIAEPNAHPYEVVKRALSDALERSAKVEGAGATRPWLQAFSLGKPPYGPPEIRAQIQAAYDVGIREWILWNPASRYEEGALEPVGGFPSEPRILVAGQVVPVSRREEVLREATAAERDSTGAVPATEVPPDTGLVRDTLSPPRR